jgi:hypothetical protein
VREGNKKRRRKQKKRGKIKGNLRMCPNWRKKEIFIS